MTRVSIATLNIAAASKERARRILDEWVIPSDFDVYIFTETSDGEGTKLILSEFSDAGWSVLRPLTEPNDRGVAVATRVCAKHIDEYPADDPARGRAVLIEMDTVPRIELLGMYVPNRGNDPAKLQRKRSYLGCWLKYLSHNSPSRQRIVLGDLNVVPATQHPQFLPQQQFEYDWYSRLTGICNLYDAAVKHNRVGHESTWVANTGEGYTYDHILLHNNLQRRVISFGYDHSTRSRGGITDHSAVSVVIDLDSVALMDTYKVGTPKQAGLF
jgi:exodeoxyribonuclease-3